MSAMRQSGAIVTVCIMHHVLTYIHDSPVSFYRVMHYSAKHGLAIACRLSFRLSVTLVDCDHIGWNSSKIISWLVSVGCSLSADPSGATGNLGPK